MNIGRRIARATSFRSAMLLSCFLMLLVGRIGNLQFNLATAENECKYDATEVFKERFTGTSVFMCNVLCAVAGGERERESLYFLFLLHVAPTRFVHSHQLPSGL